MSRVGVLAAALVVTCGCAEKPPAAPDTGAKTAAETFFTALIEHDPRRAYDVIDPDSRRRVSSDQFARLADTYAQHLGFPAEKVHVRACEEHGDAATAHVVLTGRSHRYEDGITLKRSGERWGVVLPDNFGRKAR
ncbi:MAG TPA: hypothetical protein VKE74_07625 [Gemmataceae bacterium]|nr:hypothetical protein [Gemmataceae bacterium]